MIHIIKHIFIHSIWHTTKNTLNPVYFTHVTVIIIIKYIPPVLKKGFFVYNHILFELIT